MKSMTTIIGIILIVLGAIGLIYGGITYTTNRDVLDVGGIHLDVKEQKQLPLSPIFGGVVLLCGIGLVIFGQRARTGG
jgi:uncharacterized membrane protein